MTPSLVDSYLLPGPMTDPGTYAGMYQDLPNSVTGLVQAVQGLQVHVFWTERYKINPPEERGTAELNLRGVQDKLKRILELDPAPLNQRRTPEQRLLGNCRDFSLLLVSFLKSKGIPARARCGFATYFIPDWFEDHWVVEYWKQAEGRWVMVDAQLDALQQQALAIDFDPLDMPPGKFITGGRAWLMCRREGSDPEQFGIFDFHGGDFIRGNLLRDLLALNKVEVLPWDSWAALETPLAETPDEEIARLDALAELTANPGGPNDFTQARFEALQAMYAAWPEAHVPAEWLAG